jgi:hypothetical protein
MYKQQPKINKCLKLISSIFVFISLISLILLPNNIMAAKRKPNKIEVSGDFFNKKDINLTTPTRLSHAVLQATPKLTAYRAGFFLARLDAVSRQAQLQKKLQTSLQHFPSNQSLVKRLSQLQPTGRMRLKVPLDGIFVKQHTDPWLKPGDRIYLPKTPNSVYVFGWTQTTQLPFHSDWQLTDYVAKLKRQPIADKNFVYVIYPDGHIVHAPIAYWNAIQQSIAPGSVIYIPLERSYLKNIQPDFNLKMAQFLATQPISALEKDKYAFK